MGDIKISGTLIMANTQVIWTGPLEPCALCNPNLVFLEDFLGHVAKDTLGRDGSGAHSVPRGPNPQVYSFIL